MKQRILGVLFSMILLVSSLTVFPSVSVSAASDKTTVEGIIYTFDDKDTYPVNDATDGESTDNSDETYGEFFLSADIVSMGEVDGFRSYGINGDTADFIYQYTDTLLTAGEDKWHLAEDKIKTINGEKIDSNIMKGAFLLQSSKDGKTWNNDLVLTDQFSKEVVKENAFYTANNIQLANGCYYRLYVVYKLEKKAGEKKILFLKTDEVESKKQAEVYEFYLYDINNTAAKLDTQQKNLGDKVNTGKDNGFSGDEDIDKDDPHYGWDLGHFFVSGYTRETEDDGTPIFLKNVGDKVTLWFNLEQDISKLNDDENLSINEDKNGYDKQFEIRQTNMKRGTLIIRYTDKDGVKQEPEIYTDYLAANATTRADTVVKLFEEGDYEVALDYEIKSTPRKIGSVEIVPEYYNYRIAFQFKVRNGNCMVFPMDLATGNELSNEAITSSGFKLDMAKSKYLTIDVTRSVITQGANGFTEDIRFNRPAQDGEEYVDEGIYVFKVKNLYTGAETTKTIYVGNTNYMRALSTNNLTVAELNTLVDQGGVIEEDGRITMETPPPEEEKTVAGTDDVSDSGLSEIADEPSESTEPVQTSHSNMTPIILIVAIISAAAVIIATLVFKRTKVGQKGDADQ